MKVKVKVATSKPTAVVAATVIAHSQPAATAHFSESIVINPLPRFDALSSSKPPTRPAPIEEWRQQLSAETAAVEIPASEAAVELPASTTAAEPSLLKRLKQNRLAALRLRHQSLTVSAPKNKRQLIFAGAGALILLLGTLPQLLSAGSTTTPAVPARKGVSAAALMGDEGKTRFNLARRNPDIPWLEKIFCTGRANSKGCSNSPYHPYFTWWKNYGDVEGVDPKAKGNAVKTILKTFKKPPTSNPYEQRKVLRQQRS